MECELCGKEATQLFLVSLTIFDPDGENVSDGSFHVCATCCYDIGASDIVDEALSEEE